ncbi:MAG: dockerin type I repeat-containing protein [Planctomycetota bacterium]
MQTDRDRLDWSGVAFWIGVGCIVAAIAYLGASAGAAHGQQPEHPADRGRADVNGDGVVNDSDYFAWVTIYTAPDRTPAQRAACDVNGDGRCTAEDYFAIEAVINAPDERPAAGDWSDWSSQRPSLSNYDRVVYIAADGAGDACTEAQPCDAETGWAYANSLDHRLAVAVGYRSGDVFEGHRWGTIRFAESGAGPGWGDLIFTWGGDEPAVIVPPDGQSLIKVNERGTPFPDLFVSNLEIRAASPGSGDAIVIHSPATDRVTMERVLFRGFFTAVELDALPNGGPSIDGWRFRRCAFIDNGQADGPPGSAPRQSRSFYGSGVGGLVFEDSLFLIDGAYANGSGSVFSHIGYFQRDTSDIRIEDCIVMGAPASGMQLRGGGDVTGSAFVGNGIALGMMGRTGGRIAGNLFLNSSDINPSLPRGYDIDVNYRTGPVSITGNILAEPVTSGVNSVGVVINGEDGSWGGVPVTIEGNWLIGHHRPIANAARDATLRGSAFRITGNRVNAYRATTSRVEGAWPNAYVRSGRVAGQAFLPQTPFGNEATGLRLPPAGDVFPSLAERLSADPDAYRARDLIAAYAGLVEQGEGASQ